MILGSLLLFPQQIHITRHEYLKNRKELYELAQNSTVHVHTHQYSREWQIQTVLICHTRHSAIQSWDPC